MPQLDPPATDLSKLLSTTQAAKIIGVTPARVRQLLKQGRLEYVATPLGRLIEPESIAQYHVREDKQRAARQKAKHNA